MEYGKNSKKTSEDQDEKAENGCDIVKRRVTLVLIVVCLIENIYQLLQPNPNNTIWFLCFFGGILLAYWSMLKEDSCLAQLLFCAYFFIMISGGKLVKGYLLRDFIRRTAVVVEKKEINKSHYLYLNAYRGEIYVDWETYRMFEVGDTMILESSFVCPQIIKLLDRRPTPREKELYSEPRRVIDGKIQETPEANLFTEEEIDEMLLNSHVKEVTVFDKYQDVGAGAYLEVGVDERHIRTYLFKTYDKDYENIYKRVNVGNVLVAQVSDEAAEVNRVVDWNPKMSKVEKDRALRRRTYVDFATIASKEEEVWPYGGKRAKRSHYANLKIGSSVVKNRTMIRGDNHWVIFSALNVGDTVLVKMTVEDGGGGSTFSILDWRPTREKIDKYKK